MRDKASEVLTCEFGCECDDRKLKDGTVIKGRPGVRHRDGSVTCNACYRSLQGKADWEYDRKKEYAFKLGIWARRMSIVTPERLIKQMQPDRSTLIKFKRSYQDQLTNAA